MQERSGIVYVTADEMRQIDEISVRDFQVNVLMLMENAGRATATLATRMLSGKTLGRRIACLVGGGNNGGDGMVAARHLANWGAEVNVIVGPAKEKIRELPLEQFRILEKMEVPILSREYSLNRYDLLIDGLIGYGLQGNPRDKIGVMIESANRSHRPILAVDLPSGMNATTGEAYTPCVKATATLTLALPKTGFLAPDARSYLGDLYVADISVPRKIYQRFGQKNSLFQADNIVKISR
jgi:NAD(P)H-hydrate epimerase